jgi:hypothetical protein
MYVAQWRYDANDDDRSVLINPDEMHLPASCRGMTIGYVR